MDEHGFHGRTSANPHTSIVQQLCLLAAALLVLALIPSLTSTAFASPDSPAQGKATAVTAGQDFSCALTDGTVKCWGGGEYGQLGDGANTNSTTPVPVVGVSNASAITSGLGHSCALVEGGSVKCWGSGWLGDGTFHERSTSVSVTGLSQVKSISAGGSHTCAVTSDGAVKCWGYGTYAQLGDGTNSDRLAPVAVVGIVGAIQVVAGGQHSCALLLDKSVKCWGSNEGGQLGDGNTSGMLSPDPPVTVTGLSNVTSLAAGRWHTCALLSTSTVKCWGSNGSGELGTGNAFPTTSGIPQAVGELSSAASVVSMGSARHTCALTDQREAQCWGLGENGQLGNAATEDRYLPTRVVELSSTAAIAVGGAHTCALATQGSVKCWGSNWSGSLGDGTTTDRSTPVAVVGFGGTVPDPDPDPGSDPGPGTPNDCSDTYFVGVRGSGEDPKSKSLEEYETSPGDSVYKKESGSSADTTGMGAPVKSVFNELHRQTDEYAQNLAPIQARAIAYPAIPVGDGGLDYIPRYQRSVRVGANQLASELRQITAACTDARVVIAGYSQGADVINTAMGTAHRSGEKSLFGQVKKIVVIGDPSHQPNRAENVGDWWKLGSTNGSGASVAARIVDNDGTAFKDAHRGLVSSICVIGDLVCDTSSGDVAELVPMVGGDPMMHTMYHSLSMKCPAVSGVWQYATDCAGQTLFAGLGLIPTSQGHGGLHADQVIVNAGKHVWATLVNVVGRVARGVTWFLSDPIEVGTFEVNEGGTAVIDFVVPDVPPGQHHLELRGDDGRVYSIPVHVTAEPIDDAPLMLVIDGSTSDTPPTVDPGGQENPRVPGFGSAGSLGNLFGS